MSRGSSHERTPLAAAAVAELKLETLIELIRIITELLNTQMQFEMRGQHKPVNYACWCSFAENPKTRENGQGPAEAGLGRDPGVFFLAPDE